MNSTKDFQFDDHKIRSRVQFEVSHKSWSILSQWLKGPTLSSLLEVKPLSESLNFAFFYPWGVEIAQRNRMSALFCDSNEGMNYSVARVRPEAKKIVESHRGAEVQLLIAP